MSARPGFTFAMRKENGKLSLMNERRFTDLVRRLPDGDYDGSVEKHVESRSQKQNAFYHAVVVRALADYWGLDPDNKEDHEEAHTLIKLHCNAKVVTLVNKDTGEVEEVTIGGSTAALKKDEWGDFIERCQRWAIQKFGVYIPNPDPEYMFNREEVRT